MFFKKIFSPKWRFFQFAWLACFCLQSYATTFHVSSQSALLEAISLANAGDVVCDIVITRDIEIDQTLYLDDHRLKGLQTSVFRIPTRKAGPHHSLYQMLDQYCWMETEESYHFAPSGWSHDFSEYWRQQSCPRLSVSTGFSGAHLIVMSGSARLESVTIDTSCMAGNDSYLCDIAYKKEDYPVPGGATLDQVFFRTQSMADVRNKVAGNFGPRIYTRPWSGSVQDVLRFIDQELGQFGALPDSSGVCDACNETREALLAEKANLLGRMKQANERSFLSSRTRSTSADQIHLAGLGKTGHFSTVLTTIQASPELPSKKQHGGGQVVRVDYVPDSTERSRVPQFSFKGFGMTVGEKGMKLKRKATSMLDIRHLPSAGSQGRIFSMGSITEL